MSRKIIAFFLIFVFAFSAVSFAAGKYKRTVRSYWAKQPQVIEGVVTFPGPDLSVHYERRINSSQAWAINGKVNLWASGDDSSPGLGAGLEYNFYLQKHALNGWFIGPGIGATFNIISGGGDSNFYAVGQGGYRWIFEGGLSVSPKMMIDYNIVSVDAGGVGVGIGGLGITAGCGIGYAWY